MQVLHQTLYVSLLDGRVLCWHIPDILHQGKKIFEETEAQTLFRAVSGMNICNVDFSRSHLINWDEAFSTAVHYYAYDG